MKEKTKIPTTMKADFDLIQKALAEEMITPQQFIRVLLDNYGWEKTMQILKQNMELMKE